VSWFGAREAATQEQKEIIWAKQSLLLPNRSRRLNSGYSGNTDQRRTKAGTIPVFKHYMERNLSLFSSSSLWTPEQITTALWLDADDASTITLNGNNVSQWDDKSGNGRNATQVTAINQPEYTTAGLNGKNVVTFGGNDYFSLSNDIVSSPSTIVVVFKFNNFNEINPRIYDIKKSGQSLQLIRDGSTTSIGTKNTVWQPSAAGTKWHSSQTTDPEIIAINFENASTALSLNGTLSTNTGSMSIGAAGTDSTLGVRADLVASTYLNGFISELVVVDTSLSTSDRQKLEGYLAHKWEIPYNLPANHPYKSSPP